MIVNTWPERSAVLLAELRRALADAGHSDYPQYRTTPPATAPSEDTARRDPIRIECWPYTPSAGSPSHE
jgi:hypothetical protein